MMFETVSPGADLHERNGRRPGARGPSINAGHLDLAAVTEAAWATLIEANRPPSLFRYSSGVCRMERDADWAPLIRELTVDRLRHELARVADWFTETRGRTRDALPPLHVVRDMLARADPPLPLLGRLVEVPVFAPDGRLIDTPGYDELSRIFYAPNTVGLRVRVPDQPTDQEVARSRALIDEVLADFPFTSDAERAHAVALLILPFVRDLIDGPTPMHLIEKPCPGTGATLLVHALLRPGLGRVVPTMSEGRDEDAPAVSKGTLGLPARGLPVPVEIFRLRSPRRLLLGAMVSQCLR